jgi:hypothetical protein
MHYMTHIYQRMQKHKYSIRCPDAFFVESVSVPFKREK